MSSIYAGQPPTGGYGPTYKVSWGWIGELWQLFTAAAGPWIVAALMVGFVPVLVGAIVGAIVGATGHLATTPTFGADSSPLVSALRGGGLPPGINLLIRVFGWAWSSFFYGGVYRMAVKQVKGEPIAVNDVFSGGSLFVTMLGLTFVYNLAFVIGLVLCIVPGLIVGAICLPMFALAADGAGFGDAISRSQAGMTKDLMTGALFVLVLGLIVIASAVPCGLGLLVTYPMFFIIGALAYRDMIGFSGSASGFAPNYGAQQPGTWPPPPGPSTPSPMNPRPMNPGPSGTPQPPTPQPPSGPFGSAPQPPSGPFDSPPAPPGPFDSPPPPNPPSY